MKKKGVRPARRHLRAHQYLRRMRCDKGIYIHLYIPHIYIHIQLYLSFFLFFPFLFLFALLLFFSLSSLSLLSSLSSFSLSLSLSLSLSVSLSLSLSLQRLGRIGLASSGRGGSKRAGSSELLINTTDRAHEWKGFSLTHDPWERCFSCHEALRAYVDPKCVDDVFQIVEANNAALSSAIFAGFEGGKLVQQCVADMMQVWHETLFAALEHLALPHLQHQALALGFAELEELESGEANSEDGFWDSRLHLYEHTGQRAAASATNTYAGGSLPVDVLELFPSFFLSNNFLRTLACACRCMLWSASNPNHWQGKKSLNHEEFLDAAVLRSLTFAYSKARVVTVKVSSALSRQPG